MPVGRHDIQFLRCDKPILPYCNSLFCGAAEFPHARSDLSPHFYRSERNQPTDESHSERNARLNTAIAPTPVAAQNDLACWRDLAGFRMAPSLCDVVDVTLRSQKARCAEPSQLRHADHRSQQRHTVYRRRARGRCGRMHSA